jgi:hypothetical protein
MGQHTCSDTSSLMLSFMFFGIQEWFEGGLGGALGLGTPGTKTSTAAGTSTAQRLQLGRRGHSGECRGWVGGMRGCGRGAPVHCSTRLCRLVIPPLPPPPCDTPLGNHGMHSIQCVIEAEGRKKGGRAEGRKGHPSPWAHPRRHMHSFCTKNM